MKANVLYILEEELRPEFQTNLSFLKDTNDPVFIVIQLKEVNSDFEPLIQDLKSIRIDKAFKKAKNWADICLKKIVPVRISVVEDSSQLYTVKKELKQYKSLAFYQSMHNNQNLYTCFKKTLRNNSIERIFFDHDIV